MESTPATFPVIAYLGIVRNYSMGVLSGSDANERCGSRPNHIAPRRSESAIQTPLRRSDRPPLTTLVGALAQPGGELRRRCLAYFSGQSSRDKAGASTRSKPSSMVCLVPFIGVVATASAPSGCGFATSRNGARPIALPVPPLSYTNRLARFVGGPRGRFSEPQTHEKGTICPRQPC